MQQGWLTKTFKGDRTIWGLVALFMIYSLLAVYSSSVGVAFMKYGGNTTYFLRSQFFMLALSLVIIVVVHYLPYRIYFSMAGLFYNGLIDVLWPPSSDSSSLISSFSDSVNGKISSCLIA